MNTNTALDTRYAKSYRKLREDLLRGDHMIIEDLPCQWINKTICHKISERLREQNFLYGDAFGISKKLKIHFVSSVGYAKYYSCMDVEIKEELILVIT